MSVEIYYDPFEDAVVVNGRRITYEDVRAKAKELVILAPAPGQQFETAYRRLVDEAARA